MQGGYDICYYYRGKNNKFTPEMSQGNALSSFWKIQIKINAECWEVKKVGWGNMDCWEYPARDYLIIWTEFVVWRAAIWQNFDYVSLIAFGLEFCEIYTRRIQYKVEMECQINILLWNTRDREPLWSWWRLNLMYVVWGYRDLVRASGRTQFACMWNSCKLMLFRKIIAALF